jgi:anti-sigma B factor antagonist
VVSLHAPEDCTLLQIRTRDRGDVNVSGELDIATGPLLVSRVSALLAHAQCHSVRLDLSGLWFIDCSGLGALLRVRAQARGMGKEVVIERVGPAVRRFLERTDAGRSLLEP